MSKKTNLVFAIVKILNCEGEGSDDKILQIQKQMKYLKITWAVLKGNDWWMLIKVINEEGDLNSKMHEKVSACWNDMPTDFQKLKGWAIK